MGVTRQEAAAIMRDVERAMAIRQQRMPRRRLTPDEVVELYGAALRAASEESGRRFDQRRCAEPVQVRAEAMIWKALDQLGFRVEQWDRRGLGGPDFRIERGGQAALLEVTTVSDGALEGESGLNPSRAGFQTYDTIAGKLRDIVSGKVRQLSRGSFPGPRILAIVSGHASGYAFLRDDTARDLMAHLDAVAMPIGASGPCRRVTRLETSVFFQKHPNGDLCSVKRPISAVLLVRHDGDDLHLCGLVHPDPIQPMATTFMGEVPWYCVGNWPCRGGDIEAGFVWDDPRPDPLAPKRTELDVFFDGDSPTSGLALAARP